MIHNRAIVDAGPTIGKDTSIWNFTHICSGATVGEKNTLGQGVFIGNGVTAGRNCKIQNNVSPIQWGAVGG